MPQTENVYENAKKTLKNDLDWLCTDVSEDQEVFNGDYNSIVFDRSGSETWQRMPKVDVAES